MVRKKDLLNSKQIKIPCKLCGSPKGELCKTATGNASYDFHAVRNFQAGVSQYSYTRQTKAFAK